MNKRSALLTEARAIVHEARCGEGSVGHVWLEEKHKGRVSVGYKIASRIVAVRGSSYLPVIGKSYLVKYPKITILGNLVHDTTEFVGEYICKLISDRGEECDREIMVWSANCRVVRVERNGHSVWQVLLVRGKKGKEEIMN